MAVTAVGTAGDVRGVFTGCGNPIVTGTAFAQHLCVINSESRYPYIRVVAILADVCCLYVGEILAGGLDTVMAADAVTRNIHVIEVGRQPANR